MLSTDEIPAGAGKRSKEVQKAHTLKKALLPVRFFAMILVAGSLFAFGFGLRECPAYTLLYQFFPKDTGKSKVK